MIRFSALVLVVYLISTAFPLFSEAKSKKKRKNAEHTEQSSANQEPEGEKYDGLHHETRDKAQAKAQSKPTKSKSRPELEVDPD